MVISWSAKIGVFYDKNYRDFTKHGWRFFYKNFGSARIIWPWKLHLLASSMKILDAKRRECMGMWENWMMVTIGRLYVTMDIHGPFPHSLRSLAPRICRLSPCFPHVQKGQKLASRTKETPMLLSMAHTARLAAWFCGPWVFWKGKTRVKIPTQKIKDVGDCW